MPFNDVSKNLMLESMDEALATGIDFIGVFQVGADPGTGTNHTGTEATGGSPAYARQGVVWGAAASGQKANTGALTFDVAAGSYFAFGLFNAVSGNSGTFLGYIPFGGSSTVKGFASSDVIANDKFWSAGHGLANGDAVLIYNVFAESLPAGTGLTEGVVLYVVGSATDSFQLATTSGGAAINVTAPGELYFQKVVPEIFASQGQITVAAGALVLDLTAI